MTDIARAEGEASSERLLGVCESWIMASMKVPGLLLSLSWRWLLALTLLLGAGAFLQQQLLFLDLASDTRLHPGIFWCCMAGLNALISMIHRPGLMATLWGSRLLTPELWTRINLGTTCFFLATAALAIVVGQVSTESLWGYYKLYGQPLILLTWPALAIALATQCSLLAGFCRFHSARSDSDFQPWKTFRRRSQRSVKDF